MRDLANRFLTAKKQRVDSGELSPRSFGEYFLTCKRLLDEFGANRVVADLRSDDFERLRSQIAEIWGPVRLGNEVQRVRSVFKYGYDAGLIEQPVRFGPLFKRPSRKTLRMLRTSKGPRMFEAAEIREILHHAGVHLKAMVLLAINCGFGNSDVGSLGESSVNLRKGWVSFPRPKTGVERRCPLWPETIAAIEESTANRPTAKEDEHTTLLFVTKYGGPWARGTKDDAVSKEFAKLVRKLKLHRPGLGFYALRHTFETIGGETRDQVAVDHIMEHARDDMASVYRERISDGRLRAVTDFVRAWLWP